MTEIQPFNGIIYNQEKIRDLSRVVCPPYDVISAVRQKHYLALDGHNLIHILLGKDVPGEDKYRRAADYFNSWIKEGILRQDEQPAVYFYIQQYKLKGESKTRMGFISLLGLGSADSCVFAHEHTRLEPKEDRFKLIKRVKANLSPIFVVFPDSKRIIQRIYQKYIADKKPFIEINDDEKVLHKVWRIDDPRALEEIKERVHNEDIFIADGHHRYEVACMYRDQMRGKLAAPTGRESFNYIMAYFTSADSRGLSILPIHRLIQLSPQFNMDSFKLKLRDYFDIEEVKDSVRFMFLMEKAGASEHVLGMYKDKKYWLLRLKNVKILDRMTQDKPLEYKSLDVTILNYIIIKKVLGMGLDDKADIEFIHDANELIKRVDSDPGYIAFLLNPVKMRQIMSLALKGERMPAKSTYFYPKVLSGLVIHKHQT
ncbi:MAG: DUF1015 domain-containing protein [Candidatus Omnitrophica bacterium]|nr:DUF1015 domain-containing protein [Candidatus Omnitrophota bacterium]